MLEGAYRRKSQATSALHPDPTLLLAPVQEYFPASAFAELQDETLVGHMVTHQAYTRAAYKGSKPSITADLAKARPSMSLSLRTQLQCRSHLCGQAGHLA